MTPAQQTEEVTAMQQRTRELLAALEGADWFSTVGQPVPEPLRNEVVVVSSWAEAVECCGSISWENYTLEQRNLLTMHLHDHARDRYRLWNAITDEVKWVMEPIVDRKIKPIVEEHGLPQVVDHCVRWDVLGACMENEFADLRKLGFFTYLMGWYMKGRFPCGWGEVDQEGKICLAKMEYDAPDPITRALNFPLLEPPIRLPEARLIIF